MSQIKTIYVYGNECPIDSSSSNFISFQDYLEEYPKINENRLKVVNLCDTSQYLSIGYYCSLLAEARGHQVMPSVKLINELSGEGANRLLDDYKNHKQNDLEYIEESFVICLGKTREDRFNFIANKIFIEFNAPILEIKFNVIQKNTWINIKQKYLNQLDTEDLLFCQKVFDESVHKKWRYSQQKVNYRWDLAILVDPNETSPPSNKLALKKFIKAANQHGMNATFITDQDINIISQFDALFIRETTFINHHTYLFSNQGQKRGLVVIDDPDSILKCCNKVYLTDLFNYKKVPTLKSKIISSIDTQSILDIESEFKYPMVLKTPESSFSKGVFKVNTKNELKAMLRGIFKESALALCQEYLYTSYDWRVGILNNKPIYGCKYFMAKDHWQIYNNHTKKNISGLHETVPTYEIPPSVIEVAMKAASLIGNGLYGIDIKECDGKAYVIEVNDNPNIDSGVEDQISGIELYMQIMGEFSRRLELRGR
jgi:glutathione synthase/RimK-type ligase-like ATP-grasp enzyme